MSSFHVDARIGIKLEYELAIRLGRLILDCRPEDKQLQALGHKLVNLDEEDAEIQPSWPQRVPHAPRQVHSVPVSHSSSESNFAPLASMHEKVRKATRSSNKISWGFDK
jgi:hypothetical protein